jgi:hypothetical protein
MNASSFAKICRYQDDMFPRLQNRIGKACALVAATLILPALAYAQNQNGTTQNGTKQNVPVVPEVSTAWVLLPFLGAVLLYSWRRLSKG